MHFEGAYELDFVLAFREKSLNMIRHSHTHRDILKVLCPEDLIGLNIQAIANNPSRKNRDLADIKALLECGLDLDWIKIRDYADMFEMGDLIERSKGKKMKAKQKSNLSRDEKFQEYLKFVGEFNRFFEEGADAKSIDKKKKKRKPIIISIAKL